MRMRIFRVLVCLVVICAMVVQVSPIRAKAVSTSVAVGAGLVVASMLYGLGVSIGEYPDEFNSLCADFISSMEMAGVVITNGLMDVMSLGSGLFGVKSDIIQNLFDWVHDTGVVSTGISKHTTLTLNPSHRGNISTTYTGDSEFVMYAFTRNGTERLLVVSPGWNVYWETESTKGSFYLDSALSSVRYTGVFPSATYYPWGLPELGEYASDKAAAESVSAMWDSTAISTSHDLTLNFVANPGISLATGYPEWAANSVTIPNAETGEEEVYFPIALGNSLEETQSMSQADVWAGNGTYVDTETGTGTGSGSVTVPETVTLTDILTGILSVPQSIAQAVSAFFADVVAAVQAIPVAITDFFTITADDLSIPVSWTDFFPFCIPGDIWELVTILDAEPEAPHFVYDVDFPYMEQPWHIDVDLAAWDPAAQVLRRLELLSFIVGLAMATRNYYIRG